MGLLSAGRHGPQCAQRTYSGWRKYYYFWKKNFGIPALDTVADCFPVPQSGICVVVRGYDTDEVTAYNVCPQAAGKTRMSTMGESGNYIDRIAQHVFHVSDNVVIFTLPEGQGAANVVFVYVEGSQSAPSSVAAFSYSPPQITSITEFEKWPREEPLNKCCNTAGGYKIHLVGTSFGMINTRTVYLASVLQMSRILVGGRPTGWLTCDVDDPLLPRHCPSNFWAHTSVTCSLPAGLGRNLPLQIFVGTPSQSSSNYTCMTPTCVGKNVTLFSYDPPFISRMQPDPGNAAGGEISLFGYNFGQGAAASAKVKPTISIGGITCAGADFISPSGREPYLQCTLPAITAGYQNMTINVGGQVLQLTDNYTINRHDRYDPFTFESYCLLGSYANIGEYCLPCPTGAVCEPCPQQIQKLPDGSEQTICTNPYVNEPYAKAGWWNLFANSYNCQDSGASTLQTHLENMNNPTILSEFSCTANPVVAPQRRGRTFVPFFVPCLPLTSCTGNNTCDTPYTGVRCALCAVRYYRMEGACIPCPDNAILLVIAFLAAILFLMAAGYFLNKKNMHLAFVSIGVDYFQVLAMFAQAKVPWPPQIQKLLQILSIFNINIEIVAPECTIPNLSYSKKWFFIMLIPLITAAGFAVTTLVQYLNKRVIRGQRTGLWTHANGTLGSMLMAMNYLYLYLTRTTLDVFNCQTTVPPDGHQYMQVIFEECGLEGGTQMTLLPFAVMALCFYCAAFPGFVATMLYKNRLLVQEDQILRCHRLGDVRTQAPKTHGLRIRYNKMYYHFQPKYWYWRVLILMRKFCIAFTSLMFNKNLTFQLSMVLLVVIVSYALQVKHVPYLSASQYVDLIHDHEKQAAAGNPTHVQIAADIAPALADAQIKRRMSTANKWKRQEVTATSVAEFFFDYNTVDAVLLFCCILVVIGGIMFVSGTYSPEFANSGLYTAMVTAAIITTIVGSIFYLFIVFISEMYTTFWPEQAAALQRKGRDRAAAKKAAQEAALAAKASKGGRLVALRRVAETTKKSEDSLTESVGINPMFAAKAKAEAAAATAPRDASLPDHEQWERVRDAYRELRGQNEDYREEIVELKRERDALLIVSRTNAQPAAALRKKEFTPQLR